MMNMAEKEKNEIQLRYHITFFNFDRLSGTQTCEYTFACYRRLWIIRICSFSFFVNDIYFN